MKNREIFSIWEIVKCIPHLITEMTFGIYTYTDTYQKEKVGNQNWNVTNSKTENQSSLTEF